MHSGDLRRIGNPDWRPAPAAADLDDVAESENHDVNEIPQIDSVARLPAALPTRELVRQASLGAPMYREEMPSPIDRRVHEMSVGWSKLDSFFKRTDVSGHVRVRHATDFERIARPTRNRSRLRARLGFTHHWNSEILGGIRFTTGDRKFFLEPDDRRGAPLSYQDTGDVFDKFEFNLDRIFITYSPESHPEFFVTGGKFRNPFRLNPIFSDPVGDLVWDEAAHPEGIAAGYTHQNLLYMDEIYWTVGQSIVLELANDDEASLFFTQVWATKRVGFVQAEGQLRPKVVFSASRRKLEESD